MKLARPSAVSRRFFHGLCLFTALVSTSNAIAQPIYVNTNREIARIENGIPVPLDPASFNDSNILSLAVYKDTIYYSTWAGELKRFKIGEAGRCETIIENGFPFTSMTIDRDGIIYMATELLVRYDPRNKELKTLGRMPFFSAGDMIFFGDRLLMAGWDPHDWSSGIFEINPGNLAASRKFMDAPAFIGLAALPVPCGQSRYFGLSSQGESTSLTEIDLFNKIVTRNETTIQRKILDAGSVAESGVDMKVHISSIYTSAAANCVGNDGKIELVASSQNGGITFTSLNSGTSQSSGKFDNLRGGIHRFRISDAAGCSTDTVVILAENAPLAGCGVFIPTAFTPNSDGKNDQFRVEIPAGYSEAALQIYSRWGNQVYSGKGRALAWDGSSRGASQPTGVYVYTIAYTDPGGKKTFEKGTLTLLR